jgi:FkbM family methyltransferase
MGALQVSKLDSVQAALKQGGVPELVRRTRLWTAARIYPGTIPTPGPARAKKVPQAPKPPVPRATASDVAHADALAWFEGRRAIYERLAAAVAPYVRPDGVFYDVGGNIGYFTKVLAEQTGFHGTVHLFEPVPNLAKLCAVTLADAPYTAHIHEFGLSNEDATIDIFVAGDGNLGWNTIVADKASAGMVSSQIQVRAFNGAGIDDVPSFIKIDVEGAEHRVFAGMVQSLAAWPVKPVILCEIGWGRNHPQWTEELAAFGDLAAIGYRTTDLDGEPLDVTTLEKTTDVLFVPAGP